MPTTLTLKANEQSTYAVDATFKDEQGNLVVPNAGLAWTLSDENGNVANSRSAVAITPASTVTIVLHGADLAIGGSSGLVGARRRLLIAGTYSSTLGSGLEIKDEITFDINDFVKVG
jgi:hypothetical protein